MGQTTYTNQTGGGGGGNTNWWTNNGAGSSINPISSVTQVLMNFANGILFLITAGFVGMGWVDTAAGSGGFSVNPGSLSASMSDLIGDAASLTISAGEFVMSILSSSFNQSHQLNDTSGESKRVIQYIGTSTATVDVIPTSASVVVEDSSDNAGKSVQTSQNSYLICDVGGTTVARLGVASWGFTSDNVQSGASTPVTTYTKYIQVYNSAGVLQGKIPIL